MRRIIHNTTAIAASLALLMPHVAMAELRIPDDRAASEAQPRAESMPMLAGILKEEIEKGLTADDLLCEGGDPRPCADDVTLLTPRGVAVQVSESGTIILAPRQRQPVVAAAAAAAAQQGSAEQPAVEPAEAPGVKPMGEEALKDQLAAAVQEQTAEEQPEADAAVQAEANAEANAEAMAAAEAEAEAKAAAEAEAKAEAAAAEAEAEEKAQAQAQAEAKTKPAAKPKVEKADEDALAAALAAAAKEEKVEPAAKPEPKPQPKAEPAAEPAVVASADTGTARLTLAEGAAAARQLEGQPRLARLLGQELDAGLTADDLTCQTGDAPPCAEGVALMTPKGIAVSVSNNQVTILPIARQTNTVNADGNVVPRAPEADTVETAAAKEAAKEEAAPTAAALNATEGQGEVVAEQRVTDENTRSSADDFEASLRTALEQAGQANTNAQAQQQASASSDDDDSSDLAKALILGLGAVAVGQMLNNNRQVALSTPDRVVVQRDDGSQEVIKDEVALLRQPGSTVTTENFDDGSSRTIVTREDGSKVVTIRDADLRVLRRTLISADGTSTMLIDDTAAVQPVDVASLPEPAPVQTTSGTLSEDELRAALRREANVDRRFTLGQIRNIPEVRALVAPVNIDAITFDTGSAAINPDQARQLATLGSVIQDAVAENPGEIFMIEGHTDTVGSDAMNLALSDRRAESVALALTEYFDVPPENIVVQGYGEQFLKVRAEGDIRDNRRASVRRITDLLQTAQAN